MLEYKGIHAVYEHRTVDLSEVDAIINSLIEQNPRVIPVTGRPAQADDELLLDYAGEVDGNYFEGGTAEKQTLTLGSGAFIPGFEDQLIGKNAGDAVDVRVTFPTPYHAPELAGRGAVFHCRIHEIRLKEAFKPDDTFAREYAHLDSFEALREQVRAERQSFVDQQAEEELRGALLDRICEGADFDIDEKQLEDALDLQMRSLEGQLRQRGLTLELYAQFTGSSVEKLREDYLPEAKRSLERQLALKEIAEAEHIEADEAGVAAMLENICRENGLTMEQLLPNVDDAFRSAVEQSVVIEKTLDRIRALSDIETVEK